MTPPELEALLVVAQKYRVTILKIGDVAIQMELAPLPLGEASEPDAAVVAGGWKRGPDLTED